MSCHEHRALVERHTVAIGRSLRHAAYRCRLPHHEHDDFCGWAWLRLVDKDYAIVQKWRRQGPFDAYMAAVAMHLARDYRTRLLGRWRPSAAASRLGETAEAIERMVYRDELPYDMVIESLRQQLGKVVSDDQLTRVLRKLPRRWRPRVARPPQMPELAGSGGVEERVRHREARAVATATQSALREALGDLSTIQRQLLRERFFESTSLVSIARRRQVAPQRVYAQCARALVCLRSALERRGLTLEQLNGALDQDPTLLDPISGTRSPSVIDRGVRAADWTTNR